MGQWPWASSHGTNPSAPSPSSSWTARPAAAAANALRDASQLRSSAAATGRARCSMVCRAGGEEGGGREGDRAGWKVAWSRRERDQRPGVAGRLIAPSRTQRITSAWSGGEPRVARGEEGLRSCGCDGTRLGAESEQDSEKPGSGTVWGSGR
eukprot:352917-Chlamydomonas_euryale.AAC.3